MDGQGPIGGVWGANVLAFAHSDMTSGSVQGIEVDVGNLGTDAGAPGARVLEIGFGPGVVLEALARRRDVALVAGVDPSELMLGWARWRCRHAAHDGRLDLRLGVAESLPWPDGSFERAVAVNGFHLWSDPRTALGELRRVLARGGRLALGLRVALREPRRLSSPGLGDEQIARVPPLLAAAGFRDVYVERRHLGSREVAIVAAAR
jgi:SAM-dependent methyltransferase